MIVKLLRRWWERWRPGGCDWTDLGFLDEPFDPDLPPEVGEDALDVPLRPVRIEGRSLVAQDAATPEPPRFLTRPFPGWPAVGDPDKVWRLETAARPGMCVYPPPSATTTWPGGRA